MAAARNFRRNLGALLESLGLSQREFARLAGVSYPYVNRVLRGRVEPSIGKAEELAAAAGSTLPALLGNPKNFPSRA